MTIKLDDGKVVLKDGRAACSCCIDPACCMYNAILLSEGFFTIEDLPEEVELYNNNTADLQPESVVLSRTNVSSPAGNIVYGSYNNGIGPYITYSSAAKTYVPEVNQIGPEIGNCLLDDVRTNPPIAAVGVGGATLFSVWVFDTFKDTYRVKLTSAALQAGQAEEVIVRQELCFWAGEQFQMIFNDTPSPGFGYGWFLDIPDGSAQKTGPQSTPVGSDYSIDGIHEGGTFEVFEE
jgi:hypothetical protein